MDLGYARFLKALIVEDDLVSDKLLQEKLSKSSPYTFETESAGTLDAAFKFLNNNYFDVVLLDLNLPDSLGLDTLVQLNKRCSHIPIVVITGVYEDALGLRAIVSGAQEYLVKGRYDSYILVKTIYYAIERKRAEEALDKVNGCFLSFGPNPDENINKIVETAGLILEGKSALYNKEEGSFLYTAGCWNIPKDFRKKDVKAGYICHDVIAAGKDEPQIINNLDRTSYARTDDNITKYKLKTYIGCAVKIDGKAVGSLCVVYGKNRTFSVNEVKILSILARAIGIEERRKNAEIKIKDSERKYRALFENVNDAIFIADTRSSILLDANKQAEALMERSREELIGMHQFQLYPSHKLDYYKDTFEKYIDKGKAVNFETEIIKKNGRTAPVHVNASAIKLQDKNIIQGIFKDLSEFKKLQEELIQLNKMAAMGQLAAGISHELNQPLTGIKGFAQALLMDLGGDSSAAGDLQKIIAQAERMNNIIENVRFFARKSEFKMKELDINEPIEKSLMLLKQQLKVRNIRLKKSLAENLPQLKGDPNQLQQVFLNLITNAKDAIESLRDPQGGEITIKTSLSEDKKNIEITFQDTGCGISKENLNNIFNPFFTTKSPDGGMGLGLSIVYRIVESHKGRVEVESGEGKGTRFRIILPVNCRVRPRNAKRFDE